MDWFLYDNGLRHERVKQTFLSGYFIWFKWSNIQRYIKKTILSILKIEKIFFVFFVIFIFSEKEIPK